MHVIQWLIAINKYFHEKFLKFCCYCCCCCYSFETENEQNTLPDLQTLCSGLSLLLFAVKSDYLKKSALTRDTT